MLATLHTVGRAVTLSVGSITVRRVQERGATPMPRERASDMRAAHGSAIVNIAVSIGFALVLCGLLTFFVGTANPALYWSLIATVWAVAAISIRLSLATGERSVGDE